MKKPVNWKELRTPNHNVHTFSIDESKFRKIYAPSVGQSKVINSSQSYMAWFPQGIPIHEQEIDLQIPQPKPGHSQGANEEARPWDPKHNTLAIKK
jgi:hypothetical protein